MAHGNTQAYPSRPCDLLQNNNSKSKKSGLKQGQILVKQTYWDYDDFMNPDIPNPPKKCYYKIMSKEEFCKRQEICKDLEQKRANILKQIGDTSCNEMQKNMAFGRAAACIEVSDISDDDELSPYEDGEGEGQAISSESSMQGGCMIPQHSLENQFSQRYRQNPVMAYPVFTQNQQQSPRQSSGAANTPAQLQQQQQPSQGQKSTNPMPPPLPHLLEQPPRPRRCNINKRDLMPQSEFQFEKSNQHILQTEQDQLRSFGGRSSPSPCRARGGEEGLFSGGAGGAPDNHPCNCSRPAGVSRPPQDNSAAPSAQGRDAGQLRYPTLTNKLLGVDGSRQPNTSSCLKECNETNIPPLLPKYTTQLNSPQPEFKFNYMQCNPKSETGSSQEQYQSRQLNDKINPAERNPSNKPSPCREPNTVKASQPLGQKMGHGTGSPPQNFLPSSLQNQQSKQYAPFQQNQPNKQQCCQPPKFINASYSFLSNSNCSPCKLNNISDDLPSGRMPGLTPNPGGDTPKVSDKLRGNFKCCGASPPHPSECCESLANTTECCSNPLRNSIECCKDSPANGNKCCGDQTPVLSKCCDNKTPQPEKCCGSPSSQNELSSALSDECCGGQAEWNAQPSPFHTIADRHGGSSLLNQRPPRSAPSPSGKSYPEASQPCCDSNPKNQFCAPNQQSTPYSPISFQNVDVVEQSDCEDQSRCTPCQYEDQSGTDYPTGEEEEECDSEDSEEDYCYDQNNFNEQEVCNIFDDYQDVDGGGGSNTCGNEDICRCEDNMNNAFGCRQEIQGPCSNQGSGIPECSNDKVQIIIQIPQQFSKNSRSSSYQSSPQPFQVQMKSCQPRSQPYGLPSENCPQPSSADRPPSEPCQPISQITQSSPSSPYQMPLQPDPLLSQPCQPPPPPSQPYHLQSQPCVSPLQPVDPPLPPSEPCLMQPQPYPLSSPNCLQPMQPPSEPYQLLMKSHSPQSPPPSFQACQPPLQHSQLQSMQNYYPSPPYQLQSQPCQPPMIPFQSYQQPLQHQLVHKQQPVVYQKLKPQCQTYQPISASMSCPSTQQTSSQPFVSFPGVDNYNNNTVKMPDQQSVPAPYWFPIDSPGDMNLPTFDSSGNKSLAPRILSVGHGGNTSPQNYPVNQNNYGGQQQQFSSFPVDNAGKVPFTDPACPNCREKIQAKACQPPPADLPALKSVCPNCNPTVNQPQNQCCSDNGNANIKNLCTGCDC